MSRAAEEDDVAEGGELADASENYCALMLEVREAAAARGLTFREVMTAMARRVLVESAGGGAVTFQEQHMNIAQKKPMMTEAERMRAQLNGGVRTPTPPDPVDPVVTPLRASAAQMKLPKGIEMGIGMPPASIEKKPAGKVNPLLPFIVTLAVDGWAKFDTAEHSRRLVACALTAAKKSMPAATFERRFSVDGRCVVIVRKK